MLLLSDYVQCILELDDATIEREIYKLTTVFFMFTFLAATQDIAVDGWGLTILKKENISWASVCNNAGSTTGVLIGNSVFLILESRDFSNKYIRPFLGVPSQPFGIITLKEFMVFFGIIFIVSTTLILILKKETNNHLNEDDLNDKGGLSISSTFCLLGKILQLSCIKKLLFVLITCRIAFGTTIIRSLKLIEAGVPKEKLGLINAPFQLVQIFTPVFLSKLVDLRYKPLDLFLKIYPIRLFVTLLLAIWVFYTPLFRDSRTGEYPLSYFGLYILLNGLCSFIFSTMALAKTSFFTVISDKSMGGTYMTLFNTVANIGHVWPQTVALYLIDVFTLKDCVETSKNPLFKLETTRNLSSNTCSSRVDVINCLKLDGKCLTLLDAFYGLTYVCVFIGVLWLFKFKRLCVYLQNLPKNSWLIEKAKEKQRPCYIQY
jgi:PAT family acetyl-CoA transporter-like MFS transporter 1